MESMERTFDRTANEFNNQGLSKPSTASMKSETLLVETVLNCRGLKFTLEWVFYLYREEPGCIRNTEKSACFDSIATHYKTFILPKLMEND